jgi:hypothetical protein
MYIGDYPVTKFFWEPLFKRIVRCFKLGLYEHIEGDIYLMHLRKYRIYVIAPWVDGEYHVIGWYYLIQMNGWQAWEIYQSYIFTDYRGMGYSGQLIDTIVNKEGLLLASGPQQTKLARGLWKSLVSKDKYTIWAHDWKNLDSWAPVTYDPENDTLDCVLPIYDVYWNNPDARRRDVRLIAIRKQDDNSIRSSSRSA